MIRLEFAIGADPSPRTERGTRTVTRNRARRARVAASDDVTASPEVTVSGEHLAGHGFAGEASRGKRIVNVVPRSFDSASIEPPWARTTAWAM